MKQAFALILGAGLAVSSPARAETVTLCTVVADAATGTLIEQQGTCDRRVTPASTFKIAISLMGFDAGILKDKHTPALPFRDGYVDWNPAWRATTDPARWMEKSVVWYSQKVTEALGEERFRGYVRAFAYGNADVSGDPGKNNGLARAWLSSSLQISPLEQLAFLRKLVTQKLPVSDRAFAMTEALTDYGVQPGGWHVHGKTGAGLPRKADGSLLRGQPYGWFVGWARKDGRAVVFARLIQDSERQPVAPGFRARDSLLGDLFATPDALPATR
ncbi:class D beta-lactamase [Rhodobium gokarnense]|uniref:Beta-lactamase n=1 Tax=Rhodobium gokarnense TaxID=364296 RepID=A0ABT3HHW9_9HYPH|nr:class D beta-lactamase [Rhodobium gokarnense]MCW2309999.1 beta-lactamase class D [Rhodobium gokarnense]